MSTDATYAEVVEGVRAALAAYTQALDDGRTDDVVATFCPDGVCEIPGMGTHEGHDALREAYVGLDAAAAPAPPRPQHPRHRLERPRGHGDQRRDLHPEGRRRAGRSSSWAATTTPSTTSDGTWRFHRRAAEFVT